MTSEMYETAVGARVLTDDGAPIDIESEAEDLYFALKPSKEKDPYDEGSGRKGAVDKRLRTLGGRTAFERGRQKRIVEWLESTHKPNRKSIMIIGDSIRMRTADSTGYGLHAYRRLVDDFNLFHIPHNTGSTELILEFMDDWLSVEPDIVHVNAGLHDLAFSQIEGFKPAGYNTTEEYAENVGEILARLNKYGVSDVVWGSNTYVQEEWHRLLPGTTRLRKLARRNADVDDYNAVAAEVAAGRGVTVNDLATPMLEAGIEECVLRDGVHLSKRGSDLIGGIVADALSRFG